MVVKADSAPEVMEAVEVNSFQQHHTELLLEKKFSKDCKSICKHFIDFCRDHLELNDRVKVQFLSERDGEMTTGCYIPATRQIKVLVKDRGLIDVLRSLAHELVHQKQHLDRSLEQMSGETGSPHENEANAKAGIIMRLYQEKNKDKIY